MLASIAVLGLPWLLFFWQLSDEFSLNPTYQFGLFVPFLVAYLAYLKAESRPEATAPKHPHAVTAALILGTALLLPLRLLFEANADWRLIQWTQGLLTSGLTLGLLYRWGGRAYVKHFGALALIPLLAIPWPTVFEKWVGTHLMSGIASFSAEAVRLLGQPVIQAGNIIGLANGVTVGVEEACSGLRSLQGNLLAAAFIGEMLNITRAGRVILIGLGLVSALFFNLLRSLILVLTAALSGSQLTLLLHDSAGWSILVLSFVVLWWLGSLMPTEPLKPSTAAAPKRLPLLLCLASAGLILFSEPLVGLYYGTPKPAQLLKLAAPAQVGLAATVANSEAEKFKTMLFYNEGQSWRFKDEAGEWVLFFFNWSNPRLSRLGGAYHRPERCLPNTGWTLIGKSDETALTAPTGAPLEASLTHFTDGRRQATLLFAHWSITGDTVGLDTRLDSAGRWSDFAAHQRLGQRQALQIALIAPVGPASDKALKQFAERVLVK